MASETLKLMRSENRPWGFRLSGGKDFGVVLTVQKVSPGSLAADTGLQSGDAVLAINGKDTTNLKHKDAQEAVMKAGNILEITIQRGGASTWKPAVSKQIKKTTVSTITETSMQYNSTVNAYSMNTIKDTLTAHAEMIAPGVMGINFMKPENPVNTRSEVYRLVQEEEQNKAKSPTPPKTPTSPTAVAPRRVAPVKTPPPVSPKPSSVVVNSHPVLPFAPKKPAPPPQSQGSCADCGRYITSGFVRVGDKILHEDCYRCSTCGTSLQNMGYVSINNKLYCEIHAKLAAKVITSELDSGLPPMNADLPSVTSPASQPHLNAVSPPSSSPIVPPLSTPSVGPTPYISPSSQSFGNLPQTPSSSGGLAFRSISPQPFKRISGDFHRVAAPSSPTPSSTLSHIYDSSGPLPFESKPYMPVGQQTLSSFQSASEVSQTSQVSQTFQQTSTVTQQSSSQFQVDYKQVVGQQKGTKFVWPPPKPEELLSEKKTEHALPTSAPAQQHYSPLATQSSPPESQTKTPSQPQPDAETVPTKTQAPQNYVPPPLPSTFSKPADKPLPTTTPAVGTKPEIPISAPTASAASGFAPVLAPVADTESKKDALGGVPQSGVPIGAGSRPAPRRGKGQLKEQIAGCRIPICADCGSPIRGPFIIALGKTWCPDHFHCNNLHCKTALTDIGFVEEQGQLYCENCYEAFLAPICNKCGSRIKGDCLNALDKSWHPECFLCAYCHKPFGNSSFYLEDALPYCEKDWNELFTTKCVQCGYPIEAGDRWVEALNNNYHSQCFKCSICSKNLEGQSFYAKGGRPFCKAHAR